MNRRFFFQLIQMVLPLPWIVGGGSDARPNDDSSDSITLKFNTDNSWLLVRTDLKRLIQEQRRASARSGKDVGHVCFKAFSPDILFNGKRCAEVLAEAIKWLDVAERSPSECASGPYSREILFRTDTHVHFGHVDFSGARPQWISALKSGPPALKSEDHPSIAQLYLKTTLGDNCPYRVDDVIQWARFPYPLQPIVLYELVNELGEQKR